MVTKDQLVKKLVEIAASQHGVREVGSSNRGKMVDKYQRADTLSGIGYA